MKSRFEPHPDAASVREAQSLTDPESLARGEQQPDLRAGRFVVDEAPHLPAVLALERVTDDMAGFRPERTQSRQEEDIAHTTHPETTSTDLDSDTVGDPSPWRQEVAARLKKYRERRRPQAPRYPSLRLRFDPVHPVWTRGSVEASVPPSRQSIAEDKQESDLTTAPKSASLQQEPPVQRVVAETTAKIIEFPRSFDPPAPFDELAEPVLDRPRILEVPEIVPPAPALGGILIEAADEEPSERRPGFEIPLQAAPMMRRITAGGVDLLILGIALGSFGYIFLRIAKIIPPLPQAAAWAMLLTGVFWIAYQYLFLVHAGTTPGLKITKLRLSRFDGKPVPRAIRRWRVLASVLSGLSLGLGFAWCMLDEDQLCWHDRITHTYMAPLSHLKLGGDGTHASTEGTLFSCR
jgi:uncharacterized RDD family membrane protein YckC